MNYAEWFLLACGCVLVGSLTLWMSLVIIGACLAWMSDNFKIAYNNCRFMLFYFVYLLKKQKRSTFIARRHFITPKELRQFREYKIQAERENSK